MGKNTVYEVVIPFNISIFDKYKEWLIIMIYDKKDSDDIIVIVDQLALLKEFVRPECVNFYFYQSI